MNFKTVKTLGGRKKHHHKHITTRDDDIMTQHSRDNEVVGHFIANLICRFHVQYFSFLLRKEESNSSFYVNLSNIISTFYIALIHYIYIKKNESKPP